MRITRAYTIDRETHDILSRKRNKSQYVCRAVKKMHKGKQAFNAQDCTDFLLVGVLQTRYHEDPEIGPLLMAIRTILGNRS